MTDEPRHFPRISNITLPEAQLTAPFSPRVNRESAGHTASPDPRELSEALEPLISAAIARKARQRRYTP